MQDIRKIIDFEVKGEISLSAVKIIETMSAKAKAEQPQKEKFTVKLGRQGIFFEGKLLYTLTRCAKSGELTVSYFQGGLAAKKMSLVDCSEGVIDTIAKEISSGRVYNYFRNN